MTRTIEMGGERGLWASVIQNAIQDAQGNFANTGAREYTKVRLRKEALDWLTKPNGGFNEVCYLAGFDPVAVRERCQRMFPPIDEPEREHA